MKKILAMSMAVTMILTLSGAAQAETAIWDVATVHGQNEFTISPDGSSLHSYRSNTYTSSANPMAK